MRRFRRNGESWLIQELRAGRLTPGGVRRQIESLRTELDDILFFKHPEERAVKIREEIAALESSLEEGTKVFYEEADKRAADYTAEIKKTEAPPFKTEELTPKQRADAELDRLRTRLRLLQKDLDEARRFRDPQSEIDRLLAQIDAVRRETHELSAESASPVTRNPRRLPEPLLEGVRRDLASGKVSLRDVARRVGHYQRLLNETISHDPEAKRRIASLTSHIAALEDLIERGAA